MYDQDWQNGERSANTAAKNSQENEKGKKQKQKEDIKTESCTEYNK